MAAAITERTAHGDLNEELVRGCQDRNPESQRELYECYKRQVHSLAIYMVGDPGMAEDLTQEIFLKVFRDLHSFRFESSFSSWLYRLATNTCLNALRNRRSRREVDIDAVAGTPVLDSCGSLENWLIAYRRFFNSMPLTKGLTPYGTAEATRSGDLAHSEEVTD